VVKLGRKQADISRLAAAPVLRRYGLAPPPPVVDRSAIAFTPELYQNDTLPDCTAVTLANCAQAASWVLTGTAQWIATGSVPAFYADSIGKPGATTTELMATDGAEILDVLAYQASSGFDCGQQAPLVAHFGTIDASDRMGIAAAVAHLGCCEIGIRLYERDMDTFGVDPWDADGSDPGALVGLHATFIWSYAGLGDEALVQIGTWGNWQPASWRWVVARTDEAHGLLWNDRAPGINYAALRTDVAGFVGGG
jgi:hypothetical protein